ncbi:high mobility group box domain-containing protein, partial [Mycena galericulata]
MSFQEPIPSAHIPRPPNAFICFRSRFVRDQKEQGSTSSGMKEFSRQAGHVWNEMSEAQRRPYIELADRIKAEHKVTYPDYKFTP